ncbi:dipeptidase [Sediminitomix flava]|uniref:Membrane dipeptidase n=1 Tax=Sediminitomix flava TaxID=379075 RepID=A0A315ZAJ5_SEDFL|nr:dipeptidase [Sediminitomix flava]PWJ42312.1 membrane dipeptidase [Sediminitomix flava]
MRIFFSVLLTLIICLTNLVNAQPSLKKKASKLAQENIIVDGHVDLPYRLTVKGFRIHKEFLDVAKKTKEGHFDFYRAKKGGLNAPFMSIYIPARFQETEGRSKAFADSLIDYVNQITEIHQEQFEIATSPSEVNEIIAKGKIALPMGMENGSPIETDLKNIQYFHKRGVRYVTLTHSKVNQICDSSYDTLRTWGGLSPFGYKAVEEMNRVGMMVDISHVSDSTFYQVLRVTKAPVIASHSSARKFTPGFERNMSDEMIKLIPENEGVIMVNFGSYFVDIESQQGFDKAEEEVSKILEEKGLKSSDRKAKKIWAKYEKEHPFASDVQRVADHIDHIVKLAGIDYVGFGSDYDGVGSLPRNLKDVSNYPNLIEELLKRGYSDEDIAKLCYKNIYRVWNKVEEVAKELQTNI